MARGRRKSGSTRAHPEHLEWLKLVEVSGPFLSLPVLGPAFPQGLDADDRELRAEVKAAHAEWSAHARDVAIHRQWIRLALERVLGFGPEVLVEGAALPRSVEVSLAQHQETLRPEFALLEPGEAGVRKVRLVVQVLSPSTALDRPLDGRRWKASPATRMAELLQGSTAEGLSLGLVTNGEHWMLVSVPKGGTAAFVSWYATLWAEEPITLRALRTFLGAGRFFGEPEKRLEALIAASAAAQHEVTDQLGLQVREAIELLVQSIDRADRARDGKLLEGVDERTIYEAAVTVMMRLVFVFYAEEQGLLPLTESSFYHEHYALSPLGAQLEQVTDRGILANRRSAWCRLLATFRAIHGGVWHEDMRLPAYGGSLFDPDRFPLLEGRGGSQSWREEAANPLPIDDATVLFVLEALQKLRVPGPGGKAETRQLSFRELDIEQIGHVYESLLDHTVKRARGTVLSLSGKAGQEPEIELSKLEQLYAPPYHKALVDFVHEATDRSENAIRNDLEYEIEADDSRWLVACGNDPELLARLRPFASLVREDRREEPVVIRPGSLYVTSGSDRRSTGTHYTPKSLTEPIVKHTLEPLVYAGPAEGKPESEWRLKSPWEILDLKICDMTCGSGAFLVQACRYLSERLVEAWSDLEKENPSKVLVSPLGDMAEGKDTERAIPRDASERLAIARRAVLDRCLYGVDINPMAVEMAKLSLWLITLQRDRPFTFLDHALKCGDSLLGVCSVHHIENFSLRPGERHTFATANLFRYVDEASAKRRALEDLPSNDHTQIETKNRLHAEAEAATAKVKALADCLIAFELRGLDGDAYEDQRAAEADHVQRLMKRDADASHQLPALSSQLLPQHAREQLDVRRPFHWPVEFSEVMARGGFDAFVGNPPFMGGFKISGSFGDDYLGYLLSAYSGTSGNGDLVSFFLRRVSEMLGAGGTLGLVTTNSIARGAARENGLEYLCRNGYRIYSAWKSTPWPGAANVSISILHIRKGTWHGNVQLNGCPEQAISSYLDAEIGQFAPHRLQARVRKAFRGSTISGEGFVLSPAERQALIAEDARSAEVIRPFLTGQDINQNPEHSPERFVIDLGAMDEPTAQSYSACWKHLWNTVRLQRQGNKIESRVRSWWQFIGRQEELYASVAGFGRILGCPQVSKYWGVAWLAPHQVFADKVVVFALNTDAEFALLMSSFHTEWAEKTSSRLEDRPNYNLAKTFESFPFPVNLRNLENIGERYSKHRQQLMRARGEGLTRTYNRFHDRGEQSADIARLRALHVEMDQAVAAAYGWSDLGLGHGFHATKQGERYTLSDPARRTVLDHLLALNHQRYEEEVKAGLHEKWKRRPRAQRVGAKSAHPELDFEVGAATAARTEARAMESILAALRKAAAPLEKASLIAAAGIEEDAWGSAIRQLKDAGVVIQEGSKRGAAYRLP